MLISCDVIVYDNVNFWVPSVSPNIPSVAVNSTGVTSSDNSYASTKEIVPPGFISPY